MVAPRNPKGFPHGKKLFFDELALIFFPLTSRRKAVGMTEQTKLGEDSLRIDFDGLFSRLAKSTFRSKFRLSDQDRAYAIEKGRELIRLHAMDLISSRLAPAFPANDGKQTPMKGHPVFTAQHAVGCCCRGCLSKWHGIPKGRVLSEEEKEYVVSVILEWIRRDLGKPAATRKIRKGDTLPLFQDLP